MKKILLGLLCLPSLLSAKVTLPAIFNNGMVLQQNTQVKIWGKADSKDVVKIQPSWSEQSFTAQPDDEGKWSIRIQTQKADFKPYSMTITHNGQTLSFNDILFGEVWLCSGQSNMEMKMRGWFRSPVTNGREAIANSRNEYIRLFNVEKSLSVKEKDYCTGMWKKAEPRTISYTSATAYFFGRQLFRTLNVPVALVTSHWGSAAICAFMSEKSLSTFPDYVEKIKKLDPKKMNVFAPTGIFNGMIKPIEGYSLKGVIWYQGETDRKIPDTYRKLFKSMIDDWRDRWEIADLPIVFAQVAPFDYPNEVGNSAYIREAQLYCQKENKHAYMVSLTDLGEEHNIHPSAKEPVGLRMALRALDKVYKVEGLCTDEPMYKSMEIKGNKVLLSFENADNGFSTHGKELKSFTVAGSDKVFYPAVAIVKNSKIEVYSKEVPHPVAVRYAFTEFDEGLLMNIEGCCASSFRTDNWKEEECTFK